MAMGNPEPLPSGGGVSFFATGVLKAKPRPAGVSWPGACLTAMGMVEAVLSVSPWARSQGQLILESTGKVGVTE